jgi:hypothetical protein
MCSSYEEWSRKWWLPGVDGPYNHFERDLPIPKLTKAEIEAIEYRDHLIRDVPVTQGPDALNSWLQQPGVKDEWIPLIYQNALDLATTGGHCDILEWLFKQGYEKRDEVSAMCTFNAACISGHWDYARTAYRLYGITPVGVAVFIVLKRTLLKTRAAGHEHIINWIVSDILKEFPPDLLEGVTKYASIPDNCGDGSLDVLDRVQSHFKGMPCYVK